MTEELQKALEILEKTAASLTARLTLTDGMHVFDGHFPTLAILPGVVQLNIVEMLTEEWTHRQLRITGIPQMKFTVPLRPGDVVIVKLTLTENEAGLSVTFTYEKTKADGSLMPASRGKIAFTDR